MDLQGIWKCLFRSSVSHTIYIDAAIVRWRSKANSTPICMASQGKTVDGICMIPYRGIVQELGSKLRLLRRASTWRKDMWPKKQRTIRTAKKHHNKNLELLRRSPRAQFSGEKEERNMWQWYVMSQEADLPSSDDQISCNLTAPQRASTLLANQLNPRHPCLIQHHYQ